MSEHGGRYARLAAALNRAGYAVWAHDHRGHGLNPTPPVGLGHFADADGGRAIVDDAWAVSMALQASHPELPLLLFAHSMGSFVGQALIGEHGAAYRGVVLSGSNGPPGIREAVVRVIAWLQLRAVGGRAPGMWIRATRHVELPPAVRTHPHTIRLALARSGGGRSLPGGPSVRHAA
jgi:alpha-beta hydrolase superfamily lysophospholipase